MKGRVARGVCEGVDVEEGVTVAGGETESVRVSLDERETVGEPVAAKYGVRLGESEGEGVEEGLEVELLLEEPDGVVLGVTTATLPLAVDEAVGGIVDRELSVPRMVGELVRVEVRVAFMSKLVVG